MKSGGNRRKRYSKARNLSNEQLRGIIKSNVLNGDSNSDISNIHNIKLNDVEKSIEWLKRNDPEIKAFFKKKNKEKPGIDEVIKNNICSDYESGNYTQRALAEKYNIPYTAINNILHSILPNEVIDKIKASNKKKQAIIETPKENDIVKVEENVPEDGEVIINTLSKYEDIFLSSNLIHVNPNQSYITVGLVNNRHNMGIDNFIFDNIDDKDIYNFAKLENVVKDYITNNIIFEDGIPTQGLIVRCTGLQSAIMSLTKVCYDMKINLIIAHHQIANDTKFLYRQQPIFSDFEIRSKIPYTLSYIAGVISNPDNVYLYESKLEDYKDINTFYEIHIISKEESARGDKNNTSKPLDELYILTNDFYKLGNMNLALSRIFTTDREYYRAIIVREHKFDSNTTFGYSSKILMRSYY